MTKTEIYEMIKNIAPYERYHGGYILIGEKDNWIVKNKRKLVAAIKDELKENPNQCLKVKTFQKIGQEWHPNAPIVIKEPTLPSDLKKEIKNKYKNDYKLSIKEIKNIDLLSIYKELKEKYFYDKGLDKKFEKIEWSKRMTSCAGKCYGSGKIRLSIDYHRKHPEEIEGTVAHEMIHLYTNGHSKGFYNEMYEINKRSEQKLAITRHSKERAKVAYVGVCPKHKDVGTRSKSPKGKRGYTCRKCGSKISWVEIE